MKPVFIHSLSLSAILASSSPSLHADQTYEASRGGTFETTTDRAAWERGYYINGATTSAGFYQNSDNAHEGDWYAYLGDLGLGYNNAHGYLYQYLLPQPGSDATYIDVSYYINITSEEGTSYPYDTMTNSLRFFDDQLNMIKQVDLFVHDNKTQDQLGNYRYKHIRYTLGDMAGKWVTVIFIAKTDSSNRTTFRIDNVSVVVGRPDPIYTVTATAGTGGSISPEGDQFVAANGSISFTATPDSTHVVDKWYVDGNVRQTGGTTFSLSAITASTSVNVTFKLKTYTLHISAANGQVTVTPQLAEHPHGGEITLAATPSPGYWLYDWRGDVSGVGNLLRFRITKNTTIQAYFLQLNQPVSMQIAQSTPAVGYEVSVPKAPEMLHILQCSDDLYCWRNMRVLDGDQVNMFDFNPTTSSHLLEAFRLQQISRSGVTRFLSFPIKNKTPFNTDVSSIFDHHGQRYVKDGVIMTYLGEVARISASGGWRYVAGSPPERVSLDPSSPNYYALFPVVGYERTPTSQKVLAFRYPDANILWYDGHPGYDYIVSSSEEVLAAASGYVIPEDSDDCFNAICIDHGNGYRTYYLHLSHRSDNLKNTQGNLLRVWVNEGDVIGRPGNFSCRADLGVHLHFEVKQNNSAGSWIAVDPYGKYAENGDVIMHSLWR